MDELSWLQCLVLVYLLICAVRDVFGILKLIFNKPSKTPDLVKTPKDHSCAKSTHQTGLCFKTEDIQHVYQLTAAHKANDLRVFGQLKSFKR